MSADTCTEFTNIHNYDPWVVPHQVLPAMAVIIGLDWKYILIIMYVWETLEVIFLNCLQISDSEKTSNALISDPIQCCVGILVGLMILKKFNGGAVLISDTTESIIWSSLFILPGIPLIIGGDYIWGYIPSFVICALILRHRVSTRKLTIAIITYALFISIVVFSVAGKFNDFYLALISGFVSLFVMFLFNDK